ncbi:MAG: hypothetical protein IKD00_03230 [Candidatus Methanomethylophilaceae archaeon]|nr:hypothetical protein [Candidatus Methanomethylophilaceae archaeon]
MTPRIPVVLAVALLAVLSCVSFPVTDSWFSDTDSVDVFVELDRTQEELGSLSISYGDSILLQGNEDGSYTLVEEDGPYTLVANRDVTLRMSTVDVQSSVFVSKKDVSGVNISDGSTFSAIAYEPYIITVVGEVTVTEVPST